MNDAVRIHVALKTAPAKFMSVHFAAPKNCMEAVTLTCMHVIM